MEGADRLHYWSGRVADKADLAAEVVREFAAEPATIMTSWGKDATVVVHLALAAGVRVPVVHIAQPVADPTGECEAVGAAVVALFPGAEYRRIESWPDGSEFREGKPTPELLAGSRVAAEVFGTRRWVNGLRRAEKGGRQFRRAAVCGISCAPLFDWSTADVFAYLAHHDVPTHPRYAMLGGGRWPRERLRVCTFGGYRGGGGGRSEWEREYYGDVLRRLESASRTASGPGDSRPASLG